MRLSLLAALVVVGPALAADPTPAELFPLSVGRTWTYRVSNGGPQVQDERFVIKVVGDETIRGVACFKLEASLGDRGVVATEYVGPMPTGEGIARFRIEKEELSPPVVFLKPFKARGEKWGSGTFQIGSRSATAKFEALTEDVKVKAGAFKAVKVVAESREGPGDGGVRKTHVWYAAGIGIVKQWIDGRPGGFPPLVLELESYEKGESK
jgi:hypothetical protein